MLEVRHLTHVVALAEHRNFARAAASLNLSQPALSRSIQALESQLGLRLFDRGQRGVDPTEAGQLLLRRARVLVAQMEDLEQETSAVSRGRVGDLKISAGPYPAKMVVGRAVGELVSERLDLKFRVIVDTWAEATRMVRDREVDVAVCDISEVDRDVFEIFPLREHQAYPVVRRAHPLVGKAGVKFSEVRKWPHAISAALPPRVLAPITAMLKGGQSPTAVQCEDIEILKEVAKRSDVVIFMPLCLVEAELADGGLAFLPCEEPWLRTMFGIVKLKAKTLPPAFDHFFQKVIEADQDCSRLCDELLRKYGGR